jgi:hypothetical protein
VETRLARRDAKTLVNELTDFIGQYVTNGDSQEPADSQRV